MSDNNEINEITSTTIPSGTVDPGAGPSAGVDAVDVPDCGPKQGTDPNPVEASAPSPAGPPQDNDQLVSEPDSEAAGNSQNLEEPRSTASSLRAETARRNGSKSHGPTTEEGKSRSRLNALKHGLRAETLLLETSSEHEKAVFEDLRARLEEQFMPRTLEEQLLLESMIHAIWQKRRCLRFETEELRQDFIFHGPVMDRILRYATSADKRLFRALNELKRLQKGDPYQTDSPDTAPQTEGV